MDEAVGTMATRASGPPARLTNAERMSLSRSLSSAPPMAITGPAVTMPSGPDAAGSVATLSLIALPATPATPPHAYNRRRRGSLPRRYPVSMRVTAMTLHRGAVVRACSSGFFCPIYPIYWYSLARLHAAVTRHVDGAVIDRP